MMKARERKNGKGGATTAANRRKKNRSLDFRDELFLESHSSDAYGLSSDESISSGSTFSSRNRTMRKRNSRRDSKHEHADNHYPAVAVAAFGQDDNNDDYSYSDEYGDLINNQGFVSKYTHETSAKKNSVLPLENFSYDTAIPSYGSSTPGVVYDSGVGNSFGTHSHSSGTLMGFQNQHYHRNNAIYSDEEDYEDERHPILSTKKHHVKKRERENSISGGSVTMSDNNYNYTGFAGFGQPVNQNNGKYHSPGQMKNNHKKETRQAKLQNNKKTKKNQTKKLQKRRRRHRRRNSVPQHIRLAHTKARAITERFLGLLRAEIDKITLFTHSRMGELTDTIGSLRFPSDQMEYNRQNNDHLGIHPSGSSSSDEGPDHLSTSSNEKSRDDEKFISKMKPPLFPRRKKDTRVDKAQEDEDHVKKSAWRQIKIGEQLRKGRHLFQRSDYVLGEDFLLLSAVDEADAYTTVGVEFLHLIRYICINAVAVRKLCMKHDRLLASRMLGGYYHRRSQSSRTGMQHKLTGNYDSVIQGLANNSVAEDLTKSLNLALSEYEVSRRRADILCRLKDHSSKKGLDDNIAVLPGEEEVSCYNFPRPNFSKSSATPTMNITDIVEEKETKSDDAPSTSSSISLTRLRFAVASVLSLREATMKKNEPLNEFLSRTMLAIDGSHVVGDPRGLHDCSRDTLEFLVQYDPDSILLLDSSILSDSLSIEHDGQNMVYRLCDDKLESDNETSSKTLVEFSTRSHFPPIAKAPYLGHRILLSRNLSCIALATMNYYIIIPSAASYCYKLNGLHIHSVILIGAASLTCILSCILQTVSYVDRTKQTVDCREKMFHRHLSLSAIFPWIGNLIYIIAFQRRHIWLGVFGRLFVGLSSADIINKRIVVTHAEANNMIQEMAKLRKTQLFSIFVGLLIGSILDISETFFEIRGHMIVFNFQTLPAYVMFFAWTLQLLTSICSPIPLMHDENTTKHQFEDNVSLSENDDHSFLRRSRARSSSDQSKLEAFLKLERGISDTSATYQKLERGISDISAYHKPNAHARNGQGVTYQKLHHRKWKTTLRRTAKLILHNIAIPITLALHLFANMTIELIMSSCVIITHRYFNWSGTKAGFFLSLLAFCFIPMHMIASYLGFCYGERCVLRKGLIAILSASVVGINYEALYILMKEIDSILRKEDSPNDTTTKYFDWNIGLEQYCLATCILFLCSIVIESASLSLMSKVSYSRLNASSINCSTLSPLISCIGKIIGSTILVVVGLSHRMIYTDIVNSISFFLIMSCACCYHVVKKHYFFLYGTK